MVLWLRAKVRESGLMLWPMLSLSVTHSTTAAAVYGLCRSISAMHLPFDYHTNIHTISYTHYGVMS